MISQEYLKYLLDYDKENGIFKWKIFKGSKAKIGDTAGSPDGDGYTCIRIDKKLYKAHRLAWLYVYGVEPKNIIDHINGIRNDNRIKNLRDVTISENGQNMKNAHADNKSGLLGIRYHERHKKWYANLQVNKKAMYLGNFETKELAHQAYLEAKRKFHSTCTI